eukprot:1295444-Amorphochlora_amoeboformis.AAC.1
MPYQPPKPPAGSGSCNGGVASEGQERTRGLPEECSRVIYTHEITLDHWKREERVDSLINQTHKDASERKPTCPEYEKQVTLIHLQQALISNN